ncbi:methyltransferase domain-containing protein [Streptomyces sp. NPDC098789]|uniref:methyltransferase domain-containing protein n=1 Tax=Streptomyces sp. NPDC098789 TaxID=3366098 RepID=UPI00382469DC
MSSSPFRLRTTGPAVAADDLDRVLEESAASTGIRRLRAWTRGVLDIRPGGTAVDVGCGNGAWTQQLALCTGSTGQAVGVEPHHGLRAIAVRRAEQAASRARFVAGDALALPFSSRSTDVVWCERVLQHLDEPGRAVAEISRVLRPGGRVALLDTDWATLVLSPGDPDTVRALARGAAARVASPYEGRNLAGRLTGAGLEVTAMGSQATLRTHRDVRWESLRRHAGRAVELGLATTVQIQDLMNGLARAAADKTLHCSVTVFAAVARRT